MSRANASSLALQVGFLPRRYRKRIVERLRLLVATLDDGPQTGTVKQLLNRLESAMTPVSSEKMWLTLAVLQAAMPISEVVVDVVREAQLDGPLSALSFVVAPSPFAQLIHRAPYRRVRVVRGGYIVDIEETARSQFSTGIQRVARQLAAHWAERDDVTLVGWVPAKIGFRALTMAEKHRALTATALFEGDEVKTGEVETVLIPWKVKYLLPELTLQPETLHRLASFARFSGSSTGAVGFDCVPVTSAETVDFGVAGGFAGNLSALKFFDRVAAISAAASTEYEGWRMMLSASGLSGPQVQEVILPVEAVEPMPSDLVEIRRMFDSNGSPVVLCVGSHEPRKNHLALLQAADIAWRAGQEFSLIFVGGNSWRSQAFESRVRELREAGRNVKTFTALPDELLWAAYRTAYIVAFPSLNEGFGLPVAEALALGTPVLTSNFGSMAEIAAQGGAMLVDPRNDHSIADGLQSLLSDERLYSRLRAAAASRARRTWHEYAAETWRYLTDSTA